MPPSATQRTLEHSKLGPSMALLAGLGWLIPISGMAERVGNVLNSRLAYEYKTSTHAELYLFALLALPLAFVHDRRASLLRLSATHGAAIALLATVSLMASPGPPAPILPWSEYDPDAATPFAGPLLVWCVATLVMLAASLLTARVMRSPGASKFRQPVMIAVAAVVCVCQWRVTFGMIAGGLLAMKRVGLSLESAVWLTVVFAYLVIGVVLSGLTDRRAKATVDST